MPNIPTESRNNFHLTYRPVIPILVWSSFIFYLLSFLQDIYETYNSNAIELRIARINYTLANAMTLATFIVSCSQAHQTNYIILLCSPHESTCVSKLIINSDFFAKTQMKPRPLHIIMQFAEFNIGSQSCKMMSSIPNFS